MQTYRLVIGPDGKVEIPDGQPGRIVTVVLEGSPDLGPSASVGPISSPTPEEREQLKQVFLERGRRVRARLMDQLPIDHDAELYGDDGLHVLFVQMCCQDSRQSREANSLMMKLSRTHL